MALTKVEGGVIADNTVSALQLNVDGNGTDGYTLISDGDGSMTWQAGITNPTITSIDYPGTATAADDAGGESVIINGTLFASGITCTVAGTAVTTAFNSTTQITITTLAESAGSYAVTVTNTDGGTATQADFIQYSGIPTWTTAAGSIGSVLEGQAASFQVTATEPPDTIEYAVTTGTLPTGLSLATATGAITGTAGAVSADTTTTFSITATDDENQTSAVRQFQITVTNDAPSNHFNTLIWTGDAQQGRLITTNNFQADFIWLKQRTDPGTRDPIIVDTVRGPATNLNLLYPYGDFAQSTSVGNSYIPSIQSNGFTLGNSTYSNQLNAPTVAWSLKAGGAAVTNDVGTETTQVSANNTLGFSIVSYSTNNDASKTFGHGLDDVPELIITKATNGSINWAVYNSFSGKSKFLELNQALGESSANSGDYWNTSTGVNSTVFGYSYSGTTYDFISYCFKSKAGFSKVGTYVGNGSTKSIVTGFEVGFVMIKSTNASTGWSMYDSVRGGNKGLEANTAAAEFSNASNIVNFYANGFGVTSLNHENTNSNNYIYLAFAADGSTSSPSLASSFSTIIYSGNSGSQSTNSLQSQSGTISFTPDFTWIKERSGAEWHNLFNSIAGSNKNLYANEVNSQATSSTKLTSFNTNGFSLGPDGNVNKTSSTFVAWNWKAGGIPSINTDGNIQSLVSVNQAAGFSVINYSGATNATADTDDNSGAYWSLGHGLGDPPELVIVKKTDAAGSWYAGGTILGSTGVNGNHMSLNTTAGIASDANILWGGPQTFNSTTFGLGAWDVVNRATNIYTAYCWKSIAGYSKVGFYLGTGNIGITVPTGFAPTFLLLKSLEVNTGWFLFDNKRNTSNPIVTYIESNGSAGDGSTASISFDFEATGFEVNSTNSQLNPSSGAKVIYLAIKEN